MVSRSNTRTSIAYLSSPDDASSVTLTLPDGVSLIHAAAFVNCEDPTCYVIPGEDHKKTFDFFGVDTVKAELFTAKELYKMRKELGHRLMVSDEAHAKSLKIMNGYMEVVGQYRLIND